MILIVRKKFKTFIKITKLLCKTITKRVIKGFKALSVYKSGEFWTSLILIVKCILYVLVLDCAWLCMILLVHSCAWFCLCMFYKLLNRLFNIYVSLLMAKGRFKAFLRLSLSSKRFSTKVKPYCFFKTKITLIGKLNLSFPRG